MIDKVMCIIVIVSIAVLGIYTASRKLEMVIHEVSTYRL